MTFDPATAYAQDWKHHDFVEDATYETPPGEPDGYSDLRLKVKLDDINNLDYAGIAGRLATRDPARAAVIWNPQPEHTLMPVVDGLIRLNDKSGWVIRSVQASRFGHWVAALEPERADSDD